MRARFFSLKRSPMHSMHIRCDASTFICRLLKETSVFPQAVHGSSPMFSLGGGASGPLGFAGTTPAATILLVTSLNLRFLDALSKSVALAGGREPKTGTRATACRNTGTGVTKDAGAAIAPVVARGGRHSRHLRLDASTAICRLLKRTPCRPHFEHGSSAVCGFGWFVADPPTTATAGVEKPDMPSSAVMVRGGKHSRQRRREASTLICRLL
mmetsp:Transcript_42096/g.95573  ORF Transcript_42096/g.95573 Transcript_42096/m.95573 type:complete len:212 (+) Transcript_42096:168-803(+)